MALADKIALVTGSTGGIGRETALLLAGAGAEVVVTGRRADQGAETVRTITEAGGRARFVAADLEDLDSLRALAEEAGEVDILVNNAAVFPMLPTAEQDAESFDQAVATNIRAPYFLTAALAPGMVARGSGAIVNVSTMGARVGLPGMSVYSATKAALESLTRTWAAEFSPAGVRVNTVAPGPTGTQSVIDLWGQEAAEGFGKITLLGRIAQPREIAEVVVFLADDSRSAYLTGATVAADAGATAI
ncbi:SDR family oxidoreductase [Actinacidiphila glaucinigra]|uniref:SDR family NAD(P)-dependent oxidoreductase n=1 Tax=Actinacidiphila glaucinigra TaxID=235986 RepID=UPI003866EE10